MGNLEPDIRLGDDGRPVRSGFVASVPFNFWRYPRQVTRPRRKS